MSPGSELAAFGRRAVADRLVAGASGNLSVRVGDDMVITPRGVRCDEIEPGRCPSVPLDGGPPKGDAAPSSETALHLAVYRASGAGAVVHTHSTCATALSAVVAELPAIHYSIETLGGSPRVAPYAPYGTRELADGVERALDGRAAALMANHGVIAHGRDLAEAYERCVLVEWLAELFVRASAVGVPRLLSADLLARVTQRRLETGYGVPS